MKTIGITLTMLFLFFFTGLNAQNEENKPDKSGVYQKVDVMPEFPGGNGGLTEFLIKNITYPVQAIKDSITGKVFVQFIVTETGMVTGAKVVRSVNPLLDGEALRVVEAMPAWIPGKENGVPVKVSYVIPIAFALK
jgi:periplasmic protein TonB